MFLLACDTVLNGLSTYKMLVHIQFSMGLQSSARASVKQVKLTGLLSWSFKKLSFRFGQFLELFTLSIVPQLVLSMPLLSTCTMNVVYFDQRNDALHTVGWSKSFFLVVVAYFQTQTKVETKLHMVCPHYLKSNKILLVFAHFYLLFYFLVEKDVEILER